MSTIIKCDNCHREIHSAIWIIVDHLVEMPGNNPKSVDLCEEECLVEFLRATPWEDIEVYRIGKGKPKVCRDPMAGVFLKH